MPTCAAPAAAGCHAAVDAAHELRDEDVGRPLVQLQRRADLLDDAAVEHRDAVAHGHRLDLVVGDVDHRRAEFAVQLGQLDAHLHAQAGVQIRQRLIEQEHRRLAHDGAADRHPLPLAAGQGFRRAVQQVRDLQHLGGLLDLLAGLRLGDFRHLQAEAHVLGDGHVRIKRVTLEHHRHAALGRRQVVGDLVADLQLAGGDAFQPGNHPHHGALAAARRADEDHELAVAHVQIDALDHLDGVVVGLADAPQCDAGHVGLLECRMLSGSGGRAR
jgi:hypothetical protein